MKRRHFIVPDAQVRPGVPLEHIDWAARAIVDYRPDVVVVMGDWWDMHALSSYDAPGSIQMEGARYREDVDVGNEAFERLVAPMTEKRERLVRNKERRWEPECHFLFGNHEDRITRAIESDPVKLEGIISLDDLKTPGFERHPFLEIVDIDGISYSHYFVNAHSGKPIGGSISNRLNKIGRSFVQGHQQGIDYGSIPVPGRPRRHGLVAGSFYLHEEGYRGPQVAHEDRGIVVLNEVEDGNYYYMALSMDYLRQKFG